MGKGQSMLILHSLELFYTVQQINKKKKKKRKKKKEKKNQETEEQSQRA